MGPGFDIQFLNEVPAPVPAFQDTPALGLAAMVMLAALPSAPQESSHAQGRSSGLAQAERWRTRNYRYIGLWGLTIRFSAGQPQNPCEVGPYMARGSGFLN